MNKISATTVVLLFLCFSTFAFGQSSNATVSGIVQDPSGAIIPGVTVTATNDATGVVTSVVTNEAGAYNLASLLPGTYKIAASLPGFRTQTYTNVRLGNAAQVRLNFSLEVGTVATSVDVSVSAEQVLLESSSSVGHVLDQREVEVLPLVNNNALDLVKVMSGITVTDSPVFAAEGTTFAGVSARDINVQRDGVSVKDQRFPTGINSATTLHPDLVGEIRVILAAVDAELGRGNGQVQIQTRSGTNAFHGAAVWSVQNSKLDANTWQNNRTGAIPDWRNRQEGTASVGGPIIRNKTHFFVLYDQAWARTRTTFTPVILTPCARRGIFRYYDNWNNGNALASVVNTGINNTSSRPVVDVNGNPLAPTTNPDGSPHNGILRYASVFGPLLNTPTRPDCSDANPGTGTWDTNRSQMDPTGFVSTTLTYMPPANTYEVGDGLNTAGHRWTRPLNGTDNLFGIGEDNLRKQINVKIDHVLNQSHKVSGSYSFQRDTADDQWMTWPGTFQGLLNKQPQVLTANFTSTLSSTLVNEARFGMSRTGTNTYMPLDNPETGDQLRAILPTANGLTVAPGLGAGAVNFQLQNIIGSRTFGSTTGGPVTNRDSSPRWTFADTVSLTHGRHAFKLGGEFRIGNTKSIQGGVFGGGNVTPFAAGGETTLAPVTGINNTSWTGLTGTTSAGNQSAAEDLLNFLSGSLVNVNQFRFINSPDQTAWNDPAKDLLKIRDIHQNEFSLFFKDDWKFTRQLTFNLGLRWDFYGSPYEENGLTGALEGGGAAIFGVSGRSFSEWMRPGIRAGLTNVILVGPNTPNPDQKVYPRDWNNFGPALGFVWNARSNTTVRGGYQIAYIGGGRGNTLEPIIGNPPGTTAFATYTGDSNNPYLDLTDLPVGVPVQPTFLPLSQGPVPIESRTQSITAFDANYVNPYVQNLTLAVTHNVSRNVTVDVRYVGTLTRKNYGQININIPNFLDNGLKEAFDAARAGGESALLDRMFNGINFGNGVVNGTTVTGASVLRTTTTGNISNNLANGNYQALANTLSTLNYNRNLTGNSGLPFVPNGVNGAVLRYNGFEENFIKTNPQFNNATIETNSGYNNYHSMQAQLTLRPTKGVSLQGTYTWSKNLGVSGTATDPRQRSLDYTLLPSHREHVFRTFGSFDLPVGPGKLVAGNSSGVLARVIEGWQTSWVVNLASGSPATIVGNTTLYNNGVPDIVAPVNLQELAGVVWEEGAVAGNYFGNRFVKVRDPQCAALPTTALQNSCTLNAIADATTGQIVLQNAKPGTRGNLGQNTIINAGTWTADMSIGKRFQVRESVGLQVRLDATNIFNHPTPGYTLGQIGGPVRGGSLLNLQGSDPFGYIPLKGPGGARGSRTDDVRNFQLTMRLEF